MGSTPRETSAGATIHAAVSEAVVEIDDALIHGLLPGLPDEAPHVTAV
jgi:hypothetical protein